MLVQEEESSTRGIQDEEETTTSVEEEGSAMNTEDLVEIDQHDKKNLAEQGYHGGEGDQRVQSVSERVFNETSTAENQDSSTEMDLEWSTTEEAAGQVLTEIENMTEVVPTEKQDADQVTTKLLHTLIALCVFAHSSLFCCCSSSHTFCSKTRNLASCLQPVSRPSSSHQASHIFLSRTRRSQ